MSKVQIINIKYIDPYNGSESESSLSSDSDYIPSQTPESENYTSYESSEYSTETESEYSLSSLE